MTNEVCTKNDFKSHFLCGNTKERCKHVTAQYAIKNSDFPNKSNADATCSFVQDIDYQHRIAAHLIINRQKGNDWKKSFQKLNHKKS